MGWFSKHIMGGDSPMDAIAGIMNKIGMNDTTRASKRIAKALTEKQDELLKWAIKDGKPMRKYGEEWVKVQVLGVTMIKHGATISDKTMKKLLEACDKDQWAEQALERAIYIKDFRGILEAYNNTPTEETIDHKKIFGVTHDDWRNGKFSSRVAVMAMHYVHQAYRHNDWYKDTTIIMNEDGYAILMGVVDDKKSKNFPFVIKNVHGVFEVPIYFCDANEMQYVSDPKVDKIKYHGIANTILTTIIIVACVLATVNLI